MPPASLIWGRLLTADVFGFKEIKEKATEHGFGSSGLF